MTLPKGKTTLNNTTATEKTPAGSFPKGPSRIQTKIETPQGAGSTKKKGPGMPIGGKPGC